MFRRNLVLILLTIFISPAFGQVKSLEAVRAPSPPKIDGKLEDACWGIAPKAAGLTCLSPNPGKPMPFETEAQVVYTNEALYVAIFAYDSHPDSLLKQLSGRDGDGNSDYVGFTLNCYQDGVTGYTFAVSPTGEQFDARQTSNEDVSWNAVWNCKTSIQQNGWIAEFVIPFAALRFPEKEIHTWDFNYFREIRRIRNQGYWNEIKPNGPGFLAQMGELHGIKNIDAPKRIFFFPYLSGYVLNNESKQTSFSYNGGMDLKIGLSDAYTLDATLIPDFGQTISDQLILNLTPFEIQFQDNRPFFNEGLELYQRGQIFYSRRIGDTPFGYSNAYQGLGLNEYVGSNPDKQQVLNSIKVGGRNVNGLAIGFLNSIAGESFAEVIDSITGVKRSIQTNPFTNSNVLVVDQNLPNNSFVSFTNTNVARAGQAYDANVSSFEATLRNKVNSYELHVHGNQSLKWGLEANGAETSNKRGYTGEIQVSKISGNFTFQLSHYTETDTYDPNDLGFLQANNEQVYSSTLGYNWYQPFWKFNKAWTSLSMNRSYLYAPRAFTQNYMEGELSAITKRFLYINLSFDAQPTRGYDYFEPRVDGKMFQTYKYGKVGGFISSDYRKRLAIDAGCGYADYENAGRKVKNYRISPRFRLNDKWMFIYVYSKQAHFSDLGFATFQNGNPIFGQRDVVSHTNVLTTSFAWNPVNSMNVRIRHYWGYSRYHTFYDLMEDGSLSNSTFSAYNPETGENDLVNRNFNSFTVDLFYKWIFRPGSELIFAWKYAVVHENNKIPNGLVEDINDLTSLPYSNSISLRLNYFLDYRMLTKQRGEGVYRYQ
jgi:hypothetical protein